MNQVKTLVQSFIHSFIYSITCLLLIANIMKDTMLSSGNTVINKMSFLFSSGSQYSGENAQRNQNFEWERSEPEIKVCVCVVLCLASQLCLTLCNPMNCRLPGSSVRENTPGKHTGVGCHALLQAIFPTQVSHSAWRSFSVWATREAQEYGHGQPIPSPGDLPDPGIELESSALQVDSLLAELSRKHCVFVMGTQRRRT